MIEFDFIKLNHNPAKNETSKEGLFENPRFARFFRVIRAHTGDWAIRCREWMQRIKYTFLSKNHSQTSLEQYEMFD